MNRIMTIVAILLIVFNITIFGENNYKWQFGYDEGISIRHRTNIGWFGLSLYFAGQLMQNIRDSTNVWDLQDRFYFVPTISYYKDFQIHNNLCIGPYFNLGNLWRIDGGSIDYNGISTIIAGRLSYTLVNRVILESKIGIYGTFDYGKNHFAETFQFYGGGLSSIGIMLLF